MKINRHQTSLSKKQAQDKPSVKAKVDALPIASQTVTPANLNISIEEETQPNDSFVSVIKSPYIIPTTEERGISPTTKRPSSPVHHHSKNQRILSVKKFQAQTTILSPQQHSFLQQNLSPTAATLGINVSPVTSQSHISVRASNELNTRWPQKVISRKDIENKPWYLLTFDETVELYCGDEIREEKYPKYNKSFVTKLPKSSSSPGKSSPKNPFTTPRGKTTTPTSKPSNTSNRNSKTKLFKGQKAMNTSVIIPTNQKQLEQKVTQSIKTKRLKLMELQQEIQKTNEKIQQLQIISQQEHQNIQQIITNTELSDQNTQYVKLKVTALLNQTKVAIQELLQKNHHDQSYLHRLQQDIREWEKEYFFKFNRSNIPLIEQKIATEQQRLYRKFTIRRILLLFSELMKRFRYTTTWLQQLPFEGPAAGITFDDLHLLPIPVSKGGGTLHHNHHHPGSYHHHHYHHNHPSQNINSSTKGSSSIRQGVFESSLVSGNSGQHQSSPNTSSQRGSVMSRNGSVKQTGNRSSVYAAKPKPPPPPVSVATSASSAATGQNRSSSLGSTPATAPPPPPPPPLPPSQFGNVGNTLPFSKSLQHRINSNV